MATKIKNDLKEEYQGIKYILTSTMRTKLLLSIYNESKNLDDLRIELEKPSATILHGLKELETLNFVKKVQKYYQLTSNGYLLTTNMIKLIDNWYATNKNENFWNSHDLTAIPQENLKNIYLLKNATVPAVICECGFISNESECAKLQDDTYQQKMAYAIAVGLMNVY